MKILALVCLMTAAIGAFAATSPIPGCMSNQVNNVWQPVGAGVNAVSFGKSAPPQKIGGGLVMSGDSIVSPDAPTNEAPISILSPSVTVSPITSLPIGSQEANLIYSTNEVRQIWMSVHIEDTGPNGISFKFEQRQWYTQLECVWFRWNSVESPITLGQAMKTNMQAYLTSRIGLMTNQFVNGQPKKFLAQISANDGVLSGFFWAPNEFQLIHNPDGSWSVPDAASDPNFSELPCLRVRIPGVTRALLHIEDSLRLLGLENYTLDSLDCVINELGALYVDSRGVLSIPRWFADGSMNPGSLTVWHGPANVPELFRIETGAKVLGPPKVRVIRGTNTFLVCEGQLPANAALEQSSTLAPSSWSPIGSVTNYNGLMWIPLDMTGNKFFRAKGTP